MLSIQIKMKKKYGLSGVGGIRTHNLDILEMQFFAGFERKSI